MYTIILAYVIAFLGVVMIGTGIRGLFYLKSEPGPVPLRHYVMMIGMICGGFGMGGMAQGLRVLFAIAARLH